MPRETFALGLLVTAKQGALRVDDYKSNTEPKAYHRNRLEGDPSPKTWTLGTIVCLVTFPPKSKVYDRRVITNNNDNIVVNWQ